MYAQSLWEGDRETHISYLPLTLAGGGCGVSKKHLAGGWENSVKAWGDGDLAF